MDAAVGAAPTQWGQASPIFWRGSPDNLQFRDLHATAMTELADAGAGVSTHITHKTVQMARRYARPTAAQFDRAASKRLAARKVKGPS